MTAAKMVSEQDAVLRERAAFIRGAEWRYLRAVEADEFSRLSKGTYEAAALGVYPNPPHQGEVGS